jgi:hypothetical protein
LRDTRAQWCPSIVGERSKAVVLHLEEPIRMVERLRKAQERH